jgi:hypothetical protein
MAMLIVDRLQPVEVDEHQRHPTRTDARVTGIQLRGGDETRHVLDEGAPVAQPSQRIRQARLLEQPVDRFELRVTAARRLRD